MLSFKKISKSYKTNQVLKDFSMDCPTVGVVALMGASGIGKTTLLNIIAGLEKADAGEIETTFKKVAYKFQEPRLLPWLTAKENILAVCDDEEKAVAWLEAFELSESANKYPNELSGGMQQRVALARALSYGGDLLLLDEPFSAVDVDTKSILLKAIKDYSKDNAVILVTHDLNEAEELNAKIITVK